MKMAAVAEDVYASVEAQPAVGARVDRLAIWVKSGVETSPR
jgi:hypothetical protein